MSKAIVILSAPVGSRGWARARRRVAGLVAAACAFALVGCGGAGAGVGAKAGQANFPTRPVELVNPWAAGGSHDAHARAIAAEAKDHLGQPMTVSIKSGGGGAVGAAYVARQSKPDGHTLLLGDQTSVIIRPMTEKLPYSWSDLRPVAQINESPILFVVPANRPWKTLGDFVEAAKREPGKLKYGSVTGLGPDQVPVSMFLNKSGINVGHIPFEGGGATYRGVLAGDIDMAPLFPATVAKDIKEGRLKALTVTSKDRLASLPDVPTLAESGFDIQWAMFRTVFAPAGTPDEVVEVLRKDFEVLSKDESFVKIVNGLGEELKFVSGPELDERVKREAETLQQLVKELG